APPSRWTGWSKETDRDVLFLVWRARGSNQRTLSPHTGDTMTANLLPLVALLVTPAALAGQSRPASDFNGTWDLSCASATLTLHLDLSGGTAAGSGSWGDHVVTPLDCDGIDEQEQASLHADLYATCTSAGLPAAGCDEVAGDL